MEARRWRLTLAGCAVVELQQHEHTFTCFKGRHHTRCRMGLPRDLQPISQTTSTGALLLKRRGQRLSTYNRALMYAQPCNQSWSLTFKVSRKLQDIREWKKQHPDALPDDPDQPTLDSMPVVATAAGNYATNYATKLEGHNQSVATAQQQDLLEDQQARRTHAPDRPPPPNEHRDLGCFRVAHANNHLIGSYMHPTSLLALQAEQGRNSLESHTYESHDLRVYKALLTTAAPQGAGEEAGSMTPEFVVQDGAAADDGTACLTIVDRGIDYLHQGALLAAYSPILMTIAYPAAYAPLADSHPQFNTHCWHRRTTPSLPCTYGEVPLLPNEDGSAEDKEAYAAWALGNFGSYSADTVPQYGTLWQALQHAYSGHSTANRILQHFLQNARHQALARVEEELHRRRGHTAEELAHTDTTITELLADAPLPDPVCRRLQQILIVEAPHPTAYTSDALVTLPAPILQHDSSSLRSASAITQQDPARDTAYVCGLLREASAYTGALEVHLQQQQVQGMQLHIINRGRSDVHVQLVVLPAPTTMEQADTAEPPRDIPQGTPPPYVLMPLDARPTPEDTARLFTLDDNQAPAFYLLAYTLLLEGLGRQQPPLSVVLTGDAGTGKTRALTALRQGWFELLWFIALASVG
ncbi:hypothetical protein VOLCADRAFT_91210 [Volvox carteri f. nagariensis]|uniref:Uncharacterized protein n=1 Tax=Volvox carteri f. nagariensis TaxID=3068 RepID=D8TWG9_VOLCA|nr:uncharacterized protein VOLCADRAFT_91210 [Volvox carteri f. nagariensis]EFJ48151.1 hypothetical protein VOLCADRAFT_91210 [Volvox carteri f. nagariensis]|eukprot:XP_002950836.1 hypothetical protein VOLCADRAFT_91210 [Volvox carteri f. nagariensis]